MAIVHVLWPSFGHHLDIIWTSFGHHLHIIWTSFRYPLGIIWSDLGFLFCDVKSGGSRGEAHPISRGGGGAEGSPIVKIG